MVESTLPQGRELETFAAEHILHYTWRLSVDRTARFLCPPNEPEYSNEEWYPTAKGGEPLCLDWDRFVPRLAREVGAAWLVKVEMIKRGWELTMQHSPDGFMEVTFGKNEVHYGSCTVDANTEADEARCIVCAALDALRNAGEV